MHIDKNGSTKGNWDLFLVEFLESCCRGSSRYQISFFVPMWPDHLIQQYLK